MTYCDSLHGLRMDKIDGHAIRAVLDPIWAEKPETASRLRGRIERILDAAKAEGLREGDNPAAWKGNLSTRYSPKGKLREVQHHPRSRGPRSPASWPSCAGVMASPRLALNSSCSPSPGRRRRAGRAGRNSTGTPSAGPSPRCA